MDLLFLGLRAAAGEAATAPLVDWLRGHSVWLVILVAAAGLAGFFAMLWRQHRRRQRDDAAFAALVHEPGFTLIADRDVLAGLAQRLADIFVDQRMYARYLNLRGAIDRPAPHFDVSVVHVVLGKERGNADHHALDKVVVLCHGIDAELPSFSLIPGNALLHRLHPNTAFEPTDRFGVHNHVRTSDVARVRQVFGSELRQTLRDNRELTIEGRADMLAFFLADERAQPTDLLAFVEDCVTMAAMMREGARGFQPPGTWRGG